MSLVEDYVRRHAGDPVKAAVDFATRLMRSDTSTHKAGYNRANAVLAAVEMFDLQEQFEPEVEAGVVSWEARWRCDVQGAGEKVWSHNDMTFATKEEAEEYGANLRARWMGMDAYRAVPVTTPCHEVVE